MKKKNVYDLWKRDRVEENMGRVEENIDRVEYPSKKTLLSTGPTAVTYYSILTN